MDLRNLRYFVVVAEELNVTRAAEKLHMSQPPLSAQIKSLEEELDTKLFVRGKRHLKLTESGQLLYRRAKEILSLSEKTGQTFGFFRIFLEAFQLSNQINQHFADFSGFLGLDCIQCGLRKICYFFLRVSTDEQDMIRV